ncbi:MAG: outer membrane protein assembly factor BamD [Vicinamibacterales bacterium]
MAFSNTGARVRVISPAAVLVSSHVRFVCLCLCLSFAAACASAPKRPPIGSLEPDKFLYENGSRALNDKRWLSSREYFRQLVDSYPQSPYRADAKLGIADTYLGEHSIESQVLAINEYREFLQFYPTHERADYAQFKLGMAHFQQMKGPERDQTETKEAIKELTTFMQRYQASALAPEGSKRLREARDRLSQAEYRVGVFYYRQRWYPGAIDRLTAVLKSDPEFTYRDGVYYHLAQVYLKAGRAAEALPYLDKLVTEFDNSEYLAEAQKQMADIKSGMIKDAK